jgi:hypothetical protein
MGRHSKFQDAEELFFGIFRKYCCIRKEQDVIFSPAHPDDKLLSSHFVRFPHILAHPLLLCLESAIGKDLVSNSMEASSMCCSVMGSMRDSTSGLVRLSSMAASYDVRLSPLSIATAVFDMSVGAVIDF